MGESGGDVIQSGIWKHYKGHRYFVIGVAENDTTGESSVVYVNLYEHPGGGRGLKYRPVTEWLEMVWHGRTRKSRKSSGMFTRGNF